MFIFGFVEFIIQVHRFYWAVGNVSLEDRIYYVFGNHQHIWELNTIDMDKIIQENEIVGQKPDKVGKLGFAQGER